MIFPEGKRTDAGEINRFQPGIGMIASRLDVPVVPVRLDGLDGSFTTRGSSRPAGRHASAFGPYVVEG